MNEEQNIPDDKGSEVPTNRLEIVNEEISPQSVTGNVQEEGEQTIYGKLF